jgi:Carboxypeptidase regulatory-like domain
LKPDRLKLDQLKPDQLVRRCKQLLERNNRSINNHVRMVTQLRVVAFLCVIAAIASLGACARKIQVTLPVVPSTLALRATTTSSTPIDHSKEALPVVSGIGGQTSTIVFGASSVSLTGIVSGPTGPIEGATVQVDRLVGDKEATIRVLTDGTGRYSISNKELGRVRVRAWRAPDFAQVKEDVFFTKGTTEHNLKMEKYSFSDLQWSVAPSPLIVGRQAAVVVQISDRLVNADGVVVVQPISGVGVTLSPRSAVQIVSIGERLTDANGRATFNVQCVEAGASTVAASLATGGEATLDLPSCVLPPPPSTDPPASSLVATLPPTIPETTFRNVPIITVPTEVTVVEPTVSTVLLIAPTTAPLPVPSVVQPPLPTIAPPAPAPA